MPNVSGSGGAWASRASTAGESGHAHIGARSAGQGATGGAGQGTGYGGSRPGAGAPGGGWAAWAKHGKRLLKVGIALEVGLLCGAYVMFRKFNREPEFRKSFQERFPWAYSTITAALPTSMSKILLEEDAQHREEAQQQ